MATRRRDRRKSTGPSQTPNEPSSNRPVHTEPNSTPNSKTRYLLLLLLLLLVIPLAFLAFRRLQLPLTLTTPPPPTTLSVYERGLVKADVTYDEILAENSRVAANLSRRHFRNPVLAYVTPWNSKGYDMAKLFGSRLTHISPVWYELKSEGKNLVLHGQHDVDLGWVSELQKNGQSLIVPRVVLDASPAAVLLKKQQWSKAIDLIVNECKNMGYDGIVLESWSRWTVRGVLHDPELRNKGLQFIKHLGEALHSVNSRSNADHPLVLIYVIPPPRSEKLTEHDFGPEDLHQLADSIDGFSLMTYDFSGPQSPGPNAPLKWISSSLAMLLGSKESASRSHCRMVFLGINFYGNDYVLSEGYGAGGGGAITGRDFISLLEKHKPVLRWEEKSDEHYFIYSDNNIKHAVFYPSLMSVSLRLHEAKDWGTGLSIWEIGQGLDYFFDLL